MNTRFLETFLWVARLKSFSAAAEKLNSTQAAISNRIASLERELGVRLFERDPRMVRLTTEGERALKRAEDIVRLSRELCLDMGGDQSLKGRVSIGTIDSIVYSWLPRLIATLHSRYPGISVDLEVDTSLTVSHLLLKRQIDLALIVGPIYGSDLVNINVGTLATAWYAAPQLGLGGRRLDLGEVMAHPFFGYSKGSHPYHAMMQQLRAAGLDLEDLRIFNTNSVATNIRMALDGVGVANLPRVAVRDRVERGELIELDIDMQTQPLILHAVYLGHLDNPLPATIAAMAAEIAEAFAVDVCDAS